jgi:hypothetical protein
LTKFAGRDAVFLGTGSASLSCFPFFVSPWVFPMSVRGRSGHWTTVNDEWIILQFHRGLHHQYLIFVLFSASPSITLGDFSLEEKSPKESGLGL